MKWLVCINDEGVQCQIPAGRDPDKAAEEQKDLKKYAKIKFVFEFGEGGHNPDGDYQDQKSFGHFLNIETQKLHKKYGAADPHDFFGYNLRKQTSLGKGLEVLSDLDAENYSEFRKKYSGIKGAIDILLNTEKIMSGSYDRENPGKSVMKLIKKLEIEAED
jgi:hypothetical protein